MRRERRDRLFLIGEVPDPWMAGNLILRGNFKGACTRKHVAGFSVHKALTAFKLLVAGDGLLTRELAKPSMADRLFAPWNDDLGS